jgi:hypothetical protein
MAVDSVDPWARARITWAVVAVALVPASALVWFVGGYSFCGTETTEPGAFGDWACDALVRPVAPWLLIVLAPLTIAVVGGHIALRRKSWSLFAWSVIGAPLVLVAGFFTLTAID